MIKIFFIGAVQFSEAALRHLLQNSADIVGVCTLEKSSFNSDHVDLSPLCKSFGIPVRYSPDINSKETINWISGFNPDVIFCFGWSRLIKAELLNLAPLGIIGYHPAALPANRGRHPLIWTLVLGLEETASTFFFMDEGADSGDILSQERIPVLHADDAAALYERMTQTAIEQLNEILPLLTSKTYQRRPQDHSKANYWRKRSRSDGQIDWRMSAQSIYNLVRGLTRPYVGAHFMYQETEIKVWKAEPIGELSPNLEPGKVLSVKNREIVIKAGTNAVKLVDVDPWVNLQIGEYL